MRKTMIGAALAVAAIAVYAAQDTDITPREVKDPKTLETWLEANASDAQTRIAAVETSATTLSTNGVNANRLLAGTSATAINGSAITNLNAANLTAGSSASAINGSAITNLNAANLAAGSAASAINGAAITNLNGANIASGNIAVARLTNAMDSVTGIGTKTFVYLTLTNLVYNDGATTGNVNVVSW